MALIEDVIGLLQRRFTHRDEIDCFVLNVAPERQPSPLALLRIDRLRTFLAQQGRPEFSVGNCRRTNRLPIHQASEKLAVWLSDEQLHQDRGVEIHGRLSKKQSRSPWPGRELFFSQVTAGCPAPRARVHPPVSRPVYVSSSAAASNPPGKVFWRA